MGTERVDIEADYVVVGAGSAGCAVAARLSEDPGVTVALVEAGPADDAPMMDVPLAAGRFLGSAYDWGFHSDPEPGLDGRVLALGHGRVLGGSSSINSMVYLRGAPADYDGWARSGADGWSYADVLPYFLRAEDNDRGAGPLHGVGGPVAVSDSRAPHPLTAAFLRAAQQAGYRLLDDLNGPDQDGVGYAQATQRDGLRCSAATGYLRPIAGRPNLTLVLETPVTALLLDGTRAVGVVGRRHGVPTRIRAGREVLLAAGAYHSPQLLMLAGIGPAEHLRQLGIPVVSDLPVGDGLQDHLRLAVSWPARLASLRAELTAEERTAYERHGTLPPMAHAGESAGFIRSAPHLPAPDFHVAGVPCAIGGMLASAGGGLALAGWTTRPTSTGLLRLRSRDPGEQPAIRHGHLRTAEDRRSAVDGVVRMLEIADRPALRDVIAGAPLDGPAGRDPDSVLAWVRRTGVSMHHPCGTCAIGSVVDPELRVAGVAGLRVVDASVIPRIPGANTNATAIMIGERAADLVRGQRRPTARRDVSAAAVSGPVTGDEMPVTDLA